MQTYAPCFFLSENSTAVLDVFSFELSGRGAGVIEREKYEYERVL
jgi:hypothetical protein